MLMAWGSLQVTRWLWPSGLPPVTGSDSSLVPGQSGPEPLLDAVGRWGGHPPSNTLLSLSAVSQPQAAHSPLEPPPATAILCTTCGSVCKGEVLRVQNKYFHIRCFVCKGECPPPPTARG